MTRQSLLGTWRSAENRKLHTPSLGTTALQVWLSASFSKRYWIAYKYFRFCSTQIYFISLVCWRPQISLSKAAGCAPLLYNSGSQTCSSRYRNHGIDYVLLPWIKIFRISGRKFLWQWSLVIQNNNVVWFCVTPWRKAFYPREVIIWI